MRRFGRALRKRYGSEREILKSFVKAKYLHEGRLANLDEYKVTAVLTPRAAKMARAVIGPTYDDFKPSTVLRVLAHSSGAS
jgi:hypothetical protein